MDYPKYVDNLIQRLESAGYSAYAVGGCVRDVLLGREPNDFDVTTSALPEDILSVFCDIHTIPTGLKHGTVTVIPDGFPPVEITTYRIDGSYSDSRHPESVTFTDKIEEDLARRDFTVNAMAYNKKTGLVDPFDGRSDLKKRTLRAVGDPKRRMNEDALRIMRAFRFSAQLGFSIDDDTKKALVSESTGLANVSGERLGVELSKLVCAPHAEEALDELLSCGVSRRIFGDYIPSHRLLSALGKFPAEAATRLACLLYECGTERARGILSAMKYSNAIKYSVLRSIEVRDYPIPTTDTDVRRFLIHFGEDSSLASLLALIFENAECLSEENVQRIRSNGFCPSVTSLALNGKELIAMGIRGRNIGETLSGLLDAVTEEPSLNTKEKLTELIRRKN